MGSNIQWNPNQMISVTVSLASLFKQDRSSLFTFKKDINDSCLVLNLLISSLRVGHWAISFSHLSDNAKECARCEKMKIKQQHNTVWICNGADRWLNGFCFVERASALQDSVVCQRTSVWKIINNFKNTYTFIIQQQGKVDCTCIIEVCMAIKWRVLKRNQFFKSQR